MRNMVRAREKPVCFYSAKVNYLILRWARRLANLFDRSEPPQGDEPEFGRLFHSGWEIPFADVSIQYGICRRHGSGFDAPG